MLYFQRSIQFFFIALLLTSVVPLAACSQLSQTDWSMIRQMPIPYYCGKITPTPRYAKYRDDYIVVADGKAGLKFSDLQVSGEGKSENLVKRLWRLKLESYAKLFDRKTLQKQAEKTDVRIVVAQIGDRLGDDLLERYKLKSASKVLGKQGYLLEIGKDGILCMGADEQGVVNAFVSMLQLIHVRDGKLVIKMASVRDQPSFLVRYTGDYPLPDSQSKYDWLVMNKFNGFHTGCHIISWQGLSNQTRRRMKMLRDYTDKYGYIRYMPEIRLQEDIKNLDLPPGEKKETFDRGNPLHVQRLIDNISEIIELSGAKAIMLADDDRLCDKFSPMENEKFETQAHGTGALLAQVCASPAVKQNSVKIFFCPPPYQGDLKRYWSSRYGMGGRRRNHEDYLKAVAYLKETRNWTPEVILMWTGPETCTIDLTPQEITDYRKYIGTKRPLVLFDNCWTCTRPIPLAAHMEDFPKNYASYCESTLWINIFTFSAHGMFSAITFNDYAWNPRGFTAERACKVAAGTLLGPAAIEPTLELYKLRGKGYFSHFVNTVDLKELQNAINELKSVSWNSGFVDYSHRVFNDEIKPRSEKNTADK